MNWLLFPGSGHETGEDAPVCTRMQKLEAGAVGSVKPSLSSGGIPEFVHFVLIFTSTPTAASADMTSDRPRPSSIKGNVRLSLSLVKMHNS